jgi:chaperonin cofactor prefoldin
MSIDREALIDSLERLSSEDDAEALAAAREAVERMTKADLEWDEVIREGLSASAALPEIDLDEDDASIKKAINTLLAKQDLNENTAEDLRDYLADLEKGELDPDDRKYVLGLYARVAG